MVTELTTEFTLTIRLGEPLIRDGKSNIESNAGARWFTCMCSSYPSFENFCGSKYKREKKSEVLQVWSEGKKLFTLFILYMNTQKMQNSG